MPSTDNNPKNRSENSTLVAFLQKLSKIETEKFKLKMEKVREAIANGTYVKPNRTLPRIKYKATIDVSILAHNKIHLN